MQPNSQPPLQQQASENSRPVSFGEASITPVPAIDFRSIIVSAADREQSPQPLLQTDLCQVRVGGTALHGNK